MGDLPYSVNPRSTTLLRLLAVLVLVPSSLAYAQLDAFAYSRSDTIVHSQSDTLVHGGAFVPFSADSLRISGDSLSVHKGYHQTKSPWTAVGLSAVLPGSGQIYNESYWKAPVIWGLGGYWIYEWVKLNNLYKQYQDLYNQSILDIPPSGNNAYKSNRDFYKDERDRFAWYLGALYVVNLVDAYVGSELYDFDVSPDLGLDGKIRPRVMASVHLRF